MADGSGNINRSKTGTVPKIKYSNNAAANHSTQDQSKSPRTPNNLFASWQTYSDSINLPPNKERNQRFKYSTTMDLALDRSDITNGIAIYPGTAAAANDVTPATSSSSTSRRNSSGRADSGVGGVSGGGGGSASGVQGSTLKCDNVTKYPDRKHIEDKLKQIREYLEVTSSLMTNIRNSDEQIFDLDEKTHLLQMRNDLLDSEKKLVKLLEEIDNNENEEACANADASQAASNNASENFTSENHQENARGITTEEAFFDSEFVAMHEREQQRYQSQHQKTENNTGARHQEKSFLGHCSNQLNIDNDKNNKNLSLAEFDSAIKDLEERTKRLNRNQQSNQNYNADKLMTEMQNLHSQIVSMHNVNNEREQLIQVLDNRDSELRMQQAELKTKLMELQTKKEQVDCLVSHLQDIEDEEESDIGNQVRNIVTMKDHLRKLKDMLELVNSVSDSVNAGAEMHSATNKLCLTAENLQNEISKPTHQHKRNDSYLENRLDNHVFNETYQKQSNKTQQQQQKQANQNGARPKQRTSSINEKIALHAELEAKKRELEEIMGKHKAGTSNLNHDVIGNPDNMAWKPPIFSREQTVDLHDNNDDLLSSNGDDNDLYRQSPSVLNPPENLIPPQQLHYNRNHRQLRHHPRSVSLRRRSTPPSNADDDDDDESELELPNQHQAPAANMPERNLINLGANEYNREPQSSKKVPHKFQQDLELIRKVCDAVLESLQQPAEMTTSGAAAAAAASSAGTQNRNNATPSPVYSERQPQPRVSLSPSPFRSSPNRQINTHNSSSTSNGDLPINYSGQIVHNNIVNGVHSVQNWLVANTLQTQTCLTLTLNQCCQLILMQQRELDALRQSVAMLQERIELHQFNQQQGNLSSNLMSQYIQNNQIPNNLVHLPSVSAPPIAPQSPYLSSHPIHSNQVSSACSMPNLNQYNTVTSTNNDFAFSNNNNNNNSNSNNSTSNNNPNIALLESVLQQLTAAAANVSSIATPASQQHHNENIVHDHHNNVLHAATAAAAAAAAAATAAAQSNHQGGGVAAQPPPPAAHLPWNGQAALNNQVPPGNRANNYWDNFRSYSRQNQLSSKNSESSLQNISTVSVASSLSAVPAATERYNIPTNNDRSLIAPFDILEAASKTNSEHSSTNSHETTPKKKTIPPKNVFRSFNMDQVTTPVATIAAAAGRNDYQSSQTQVQPPPPPPPDVLNVNQNALIINKTNFDDTNELHSNHLEQQHQQSNIDMEFELGFQHLYNVGRPAQPNNARSLVTVDNNCATEDERNLIENSTMRNRHENDWNIGGDTGASGAAAAAGGGGGGGEEEQSEQRPKKNKLVEELRENVYKEVASLISANEARPHFLIQLFKDLKKVESDALRLKTLQSIQNILTIHFQQSAAHPRQLKESDSFTFLETSEPTSNWSRPSKQLSSDILNICFDSDEPFLQNSYKDLVKLLEENRDEFLNNHHLISIKQIILESEFFKESVKDAIFFKHFSNVLDDILEQFRGKKIQDIKVHLIQTLGDLLQGELSFIHLIQETIPESGAGLPERKNSNISYGTASAIYDINQSSLQNGDGGMGDNIQNGDLAEADQSRINEELDLEEEEGAVGGLLEIHDPESILTLSQGHSEEMLNMSVIDFPTENGEGLDQVPTRLAIKMITGTATPTNDVMGGHHDSEPY